MFVHSLTLDQLLDNITLYWFTNTAVSSARIYADNNGGSLSQGVIKTPVAVTIFPKEIYQAPKSWAERDYPNLICWNEVAKGGHFAAFEQPQVFVGEMRRAFETLRRT